MSPHRAAFACYVQGLIAGAGSLLLLTRWKPLWLGAFVSGLCLIELGLKWRAAVIESREQSRLRCSFCDISFSAYSKLLEHCGLHVSNN